MSETKKKSSSRTREQVIRHALTKITIDDNGCWIWEAGLSSQYQYPSIWCEGTTVAVHRLLYEAKHGPLPAKAEDGSRTEVHHDRLNTGCVGRAGRCVHPDHMQVVSAKQHGLISVMERKLGIAEPRPPRRQRKKPSVSVTVASPINDVAPTELVIA